MQNILVPMTDVKDSIENCTYNSKNDYANCIQSIIKSKPFGDVKFYIYSFLKSTEIPGVKKMYHQPRLTRPEPIHGTTLQRVDPSNPEEAIIIWTLPDKEDFEKFKEGKVFANDYIWECIQKYKYRRHEFLETDEDDLHEEDIRAIYQDMHKKKPV